MEKILQIIQVQEDRYEQIVKGKRNYIKSPKQRITISYLDTRMESLEKTWQAFKSGHDQLIAYVKKEDRIELKYFSDDIYDQCEEIYIEYKSNLREKITEMSPKNEIQPAKQQQIKTTEWPAMKIPTFSGKYTEWPSFHDIFNSLIHTNTNLQDIQKIHYLKCSVSGEAEQLLRTITITAENYELAWTTLKNRYNNKRYLSNCIFKRLFSLKPLTSESPAHIRQLIDATSEYLSSLKGLNLPTEYWDAIMVYMTVTKLDSESHKQWELHTASYQEYPSFDCLRKFLEQRFMSMEMVESKSFKARTFHTAIDGTVNTLSCSYCTEDHYIYQCKQFTKLTYQERSDFVQKKNLCFNCLIPNHSANKCRRNTSCRVCHKRHHSLLHPERKEPVIEEKQKDEKTIVSNFVKQPGQVLLATALVDVTSRHGTIHSYRALIDQGSQASFVSEDLVQALSLKRVRINGVVAGCGGKSLQTRYIVEVEIKSRIKTNFTIQVKAYVLNKITNNLPTQHIKMSDWPELDNITLADPGFEVPNKIHLLLGAEVYCQIIDVGLLKNPYGSTVAQYTHLGWIISGETSRTQPETEKSIISMHVCLCDNDILRKFWEIQNELLTSERELTREEQKCEDIYKNTTIRTNSGRYMVHLPIKENIDPAEQCGKTKEIAISRFLQLERKFKYNPSLKLEYSKVINEYLDMGHMIEANETNNKAIYLPHHAVLREDKDTTRVRVVFDASAKGSKGNSLNDTMLTGPVMQRDLRTLITEWRTYKIALVSDIVKMYRQVLVTDKHTEYQRIVWRESSDMDIKSYKLRTVTFGTAAAPFLAVRTLSQVAEDEKHRFPIAAEIVKNSFYMDDLMTGANNINQALEIYKEVKEMLKCAGFELQKWSSNNNEIIDKIAENRTQLQPFEIKFDKVIKVLGLSWDRVDDKFKFHINLSENNTSVTKRSILSEVARLFDPFGWLAPTIVIAKMIIQKLWLCTCGWDEEIPDTIKHEWLNYRKQLPCLEKIQIERWIYTHPDNATVELHGFADASTAAYAAVVYVKVITGNEVYVNLLESKTKVAPLKQISIARLELCAAVLLSRLLSEAANLLKIPKENIFAYTDSMVTLAWIEALPIKWQTFVANRVSEIQSRLNNDCWYHVISNENPADLASRGVNPSELRNKQIWWRGPVWLREKITIKRKTRVRETNLDERKYKVQVFHNEEVDPIWNKFSTLTRLIRVLSYCRRFLNLKSKKDKISNNDSKNTYLTSEEMRKTLDTCIKVTQEQEFAEEIETLKQQKTIKKKSKLISLSPYLDNNGLLRVGGRIQASQLAFQHKHPIIIPKNTHLAMLIVRDAHLKLLHGGAALTMNYLRSRYWIIGMKQLVKKCNRECVVCLRHRGITIQPHMGELPSVRVNPGRAFQTSGVDFAGPIQMRVSKGRGQRSYKGYICLFVCMKTKAIHLEAVSDLTSPGFLAAFRRFVSRRGHCSDLYSDNGLNFVGAVKLLTQMLNSSMNEVLKEVAELLSNDGTTWHFIPPRAPNFGGLWESGIKSVKTHLIKMIGDSTLTFEEMTTLLTQIEACLNSRPICQLSDDPNDVTALTPAHFLVGEPLIAIPEKLDLDEHISPLNRWRLVQRMMRQFWHRWSKEFLHTMQQRHKWRHTTEAPQINDVVIIKDDLPPTKWLLAKVIKTHVGSDGHVRVVTLRCKDSTLKRPVSKLIPLPNQ